ncbi:class I SAM-dependent methyltransferase [Streptomyces sp. ODS05-4]|uniref:class I SAM-dependent methyltransferase n=1 Tax=Streptomyces sp. ODS05-4 TaxID=2944939 RepID=UPI00210B265A|nr:class I SAM-dependent methyltransferase [Streptomyces sp. ODS05-4]
MTPAEECHAQRVATAAAVYSEEMLRRYDLIVLALACRIGLGCPRGVMLGQYQRLVGAEHLDIGPGTGYFLDRCRFPVPDPRITLLDLNENALAVASERIARYQPIGHRRDVLQPLDLGGARFESVALNLVLHCLPGPLTRKAVVFDHIVPHLRPGGRIFGSTVLTHGVSHTSRSRRLVDRLNATGVFNNREDRLSDLHTELSRRFDRYEITVRGTVALFEAHA